MLGRLFINLKTVELLCGEKGLVAQLFFCSKILSILDMGLLANFKSHQHKKHEGPGGRGSLSMYVH